MMTSSGAQKISVGLGQEVADGCYDAMFVAKRNKVI